MCALDRLNKRNLLTYLFTQRQAMALKQYLTWFMVGAQVIVELFSRRYTVVSPGFVARRGKAENRSWGHGEIQGRVQQLLDD